MFDIRRAIAFLFLGRRFSKHKWAAIRNIQGTMVPWTPLETRTGFRSSCEKTMVVANFSIANKSNVKSASGKVRRNY